MQNTHRTLRRSVSSSILALTLLGSGATAETTASRASCKSGKSVPECIESQEAEAARRRGIAATQSNLSRSTPVTMPSEDQSARPAAKTLRERP